MIMINVNVNNQDNLDKNGTWIEPWDLDKDDGKIYWCGIEVKVIGDSCDGYLLIVAT